MSMLEDLDGQPLRTYLRDLLHNRGRASAEIDRHRQELPFHPLEARFEGGSEEFRNRLGRGLADLLREAVEMPWELEPFNQLLVAVERARHPPLTTALVELAYSGSVWGLPEGARRQMMVLRTLLGLGWYGHPSFWLEQPARFVGAHPALILRALAAHDLTLAFDHFAELASSVGAVRKLLRFFPALIELHGLQRVRDLADRACGQLSPEVGEEVQQWFERRGFEAQTRLRPPELGALRAALDQYVQGLRAEHQWIGFLDRVRATERLKAVALDGLRRPLGPGSELDAKRRFKDLAEDEIASWVQKATIYNDWGRSAISEDRFQNALIRAVRSYDPASSDWESYLRTILSRELTAELRRRPLVRKHHRDIRNEDQRSSPRSPEPLAARRETRRLTDELAVGVLSPEQLAYLEVYRQGYSDRQIGEIVNSDPKAVRGKLVMIFGVLRRECERRGLRWEDLAVELSS